MHSRFNGQIMILWVLYAGLSLCGYGCAHPQHKSAASLAPPWRTTQVKPTFSLLYGGQFQYVKDATWGSLWREVQGVEEQLYTLYGDMIVENNPYLHLATQCLVPQFRGLDHFAQLVALEGAGSALAASLSLEQAVALWRGLSVSIRRCLVASYLPIPSHLELATAPFDREMAPTLEPWPRIWLRDRLLLSNPY